MIDQKRIMIRQAVEADVVEITRHLERMGLLMPQGDDIYKHWNRLWKENPYYKLFNDPLHCGWIMEYEGRMVGFFTRFPRAYYLNGKPFRVTVPTSWGVEGEFRKYKDLLCDQFFYHDPNDTRVATTAIKATGKIFERYGSIRVPSPNQTEVYMIPYKIGALVMLKLAPVLKFKPLITLVGFLVQLFALPWQWHYKLIPKSRFVSEINPADVSDDFESFWIEYLKTFKGLIASRDVNNIKWAYQDGFRKLENRLFIYKKDNRILGYVSILREPVKDSNLNRYKIVDLLSLSEAVKKELLKFIIRYCAEIQADVLEVQVPGLITRKDIPVFTMTRYLQAWPYYFHTTDEQIKAILLRPENWQTSPFDGDTSLY